MGTGLRERKRARTREEIVRAALRLFRRKGFEATSVEEIAAAAEVSPRTFFRYFPTKEQTVYSREGERLARFRAWLPKGRITPWEAVRQTLLRLAREYMEARDRILIEERLAVASPALRAYERQHDLRWEELLARGLGGGFLGRAWAGAVVGALRAGVREWAARGGKGDLERIAAKTLDALARGTKGATR